MMVGFLSFGLGCLKYGYFVIFMVFGGILFFLFWIGFLVLGGLLIVWVMVKLLWGNVIKNVWGIVGRLLK